MDKKAHSDIMISSLYVLLGLLIQIGLLVAHYSFNKELLWWILWSPILIAVILIGYVLVLCSLGTLNEKYENKRV